MMETLFNQKAKKLKLLLTDVDGVMTDGKLSFFTGPDGVTREIKNFESLDGMGLMFLKSAGIQTGIISRGRSADTLLFWANVLGMDYLCYGVSAKHKALEEILKRTGISAEETAFIGDDVIDLGVLARVGMPLAVANAVQEVKAKAVYTASRTGGTGAVREIAERLLKARGQWEQIVHDVETGAFESPAAPLQIITGI